jgi:hypothetical protein
MRELKFRTWEGGMFGPLSLQELEHKGGEDE